MSKINTKPEMDFPYAQYTDGSGHIISGLRADLMRKSMENKNILNRHSIYVGQGNGITAALTPKPEDANKVIGFDGHDVVYLDPSSLINEGITRNIVLESTSYRIPQSGNINEFIDMKEIQHDGVYLFNFVYSNKKFGYTGGTGGDVSTHNPDGDTNYIHHFSCIVPIDTHVFYTSNDIYSDNVNILAKKTFDFDYYIQNETVSPTIQNKTVSGRFVFTVFSQSTYNGTVGLTLHVDLDYIHENDHKACTIDEYNVLFVQITKLVDKLNLPSAPTSK